MINTIVIGGPTNPTENTGLETNWCKRCQSDEVVDLTHLCNDCIQDVVEMEQTSSCCGGTLHVDMQMCYSCKEHSSSQIEDECMETGLNLDTYRYE